MNHYIWSLYKIIIYIWYILYIYICICICVYIYIYVIYLYIYIIVLYIHIGSLYVIIYKIIHTDESSSISELLNCPTTSWPNPRRTRHEIGAAGVSQTHVLQPLCEPSDGSRANNGAMWDHLQLRWGFVKKKIRPSRMDASVLLPAGCVWK